MRHIVSTYNYIAVILLLIGSKIKAKDDSPLHQCLTALHFGRFGIEY